MLGESMSVIIIGGGCFGTFYARQLLRAREEGKCGFSRLLVIDKNKNCRAFREIRDSGVTFVSMDWEDYLHQYASESFHEGSLAVQEDVYIPSHWAPHLLRDMFLHRIQDDPGIPAVRVRKIEMENKIGTPYEVVLKNGDHAVSFATWECPPHCIEPIKCPHTKKERDWEMGDFLKDFFRGREENWFSFFCRHLANGVAGIPMKDIYAEYLRLKDVVKENKNCRLAIMTHSSCHGLVSLAEISYG